MGIVLENEQKHSVMFGKTEHSSQIVLQNKQKHFVMNVSRTYPANYFLYRTIFLKYAEITEMRKLLPQVFFVMCPFIRPYIEQIHRKPMERRKEEINNAQVL